MKTDIHPTYYPKATITCSCGAVHNVGSTREKMTVEICSECHPFYTGKEKLVDTAGRVEKFRARREQAAKTATKRTAKKAAPALPKKKSAESKKATPRRAAAKKK